MKTAEKSDNKFGKILVLIGAGVASLAIVFGVMALIRTSSGAKIDYKSASDKVSELAKTKTAIIAMLDSKEDNQQIATDFETAIKKGEAEMSALATMDFLKDSEASSRYDKAMSEYGAVKKLGKIWNDTKLLADLTDSNLEKLKQSESEYLRTMATELADYREKQKAFETQYGAGGKVSDGLTNAYGEIWLKGEELKEKYRSVTLDDILGMSRDDIMKFYATIEELNKYLSEK